jgi:hypothetical protein
MLSKHAFQACIVVILGGAGVTYDRKMARNEYRMVSGNEYLMKKDGDVNCYNGQILLPRENF